MTTQTEALKSAIEFAEYCLEELDLSHMASNQAKRLVQKSKEALAKLEQERCVGCEACIDTACGRDECPKGWPKALQPEQEPVGQLLEDAFGRGQVMWFNKPKDESMLYTTPPQRTWVGLTDEDLAVCGDEDDVMLARYWERVCKEKNSA